jgi:hypothetical protein
MNEDDLRCETSLTDYQLVDLRERLADPGPIAPDEAVEAFFATIFQREDR